MQTTKSPQSSSLDRFDRIQTAIETFSTCSPMKARCFFNQKFPYAAHRNLTIEQVRSALIESLPKY